ncbi:MAG: hypothetical protein ABEK36_01125 [Candidatus Aenigmatarchaeota archaeon]
MGREKGMIPLSEIVIIGIIAPILLALVFVAVPLAQRSMSGMVGYEVNVKRMYKPLLAENTLSVLMNSEINGQETYSVIRNYMLYEGDFNVNDEEIDVNLNSYLEDLVPNQKFLLIMNTTDFEQRVGEGKELGEENSYSSQVNFRLPNMKEARVELRLEVEE